ncbi:MAG: ATP-dependent sacrificial sulfur transferase LarE [Candidatus Eisenbacteria bacterium]|uniref:ATP-dependent sacrificial sulfur transferase LarE n=1 Tax=Eiseniibacteriota bacterium TaxID=2212470 RepID=A0A956RNE5_UNCEI|nr:ATP-dependent sacrificial sulfur transferase LarE [Candidatus Eisenbacteria bacterium]
MNGPNTSGAVAGALPPNAPPALAEKHAALQAHLRSIPRVLVAFSGGADSAFLVRVAHFTIGERARAAIGISPSLQQESRDLARELVRSWGVALLEVHPREMEDPGYVANGPDRCYYCKHALYGLLATIAAAAEEGEQVLDGTNRDDLSDDRPGRVAAAEHGVRSPLAELGWTKREIREASRLLGIPTWDRPASPCLSSRIPHGTSVTVSALRRIEEAEGRIRRHGFADVRVRHLAGTARVEVPAAEVDRLRSLWTRIEPELRECGYDEVVLDPAGYRRGGAR